MAALDASVRKRRRSTFTSPEVSSDLCSRKFKHVSARTAIARATPFDAGADWRASRPDVVATEVVATEPSCRVW
jgi:hypothetical protein